MPKITISEEDLTISNQIDVTENVVYVPGIADKGPVKTPTLCETVAQFQEIFGKEPHKFTATQTYSDVTFNQTGDYERSYIYAVELLTAGLKVMFDNVISGFAYEQVALTLYTESLPETNTTVYEVEKITGLTAKTFKFDTYYKKIDNVTFQGVAEFDSTITDYYTIKLTEDETRQESKDYFTIKKSYVDAGMVSAFYGELTKTEYSEYSNILDRWTYNIKFITTGGYPTSLNTASDFTLLQTMAKAAAVRGDSVALIDTIDTESIYESFKNIEANLKPETIANKDKYLLRGQDHCNLNFTLSDKRKDESTLKYATIIGPTGIYNIFNTSLITLEIETFEMPGSFGYLLDLANSVEVLNNPDYFAIAGVSRGLTSHLRQLLIETTGAEADAVQVRPAAIGSDGVGAISLNPIIDVQNYGYCIWGNRTLFPNPKKDLAASSFLNIRVMSADVKKVIYAACQKLTFETNNFELWLKFKSEVEPTLEKMVANGALESYELSRLVSTEKATLSVYVKLVTEYAVEDFDITVGLTDSTVEEAE